MERMFLIEFWLPLFLNMLQLGIRTLCVPFLPSRRRITLRCDVGSRTIAYLHVYMVIQALPEGQFRWTLARSKATSLERVRRARARTESRVASTSKEKSSLRKDRATRRVEATYRLRRNFRAIVDSARNGDINVPTAGKDSESKDHHQRHQ